MPLLLSKEQNNCSNLMSLPSPIHYIRCFLRAETGLVKTAEFENIGIILFEELKQGAAKRRAPRRDL